MNEIKLRQENIPVKPEDLREFILIGKQAVKAHKLKLKAISQIGKAVAAREAALEDAQNVAEVVIDAESRLGEILAATVKATGGSRKRTTGGKLAGAKKSLPNGIDKKMSHEAQQIYKHPEVVKEAKKQARTKGDILTGKKLLAQIQHPAADDPGKINVKIQDGQKRKIRGYYLTEARLELLRGNIDRIIELLDVPARSMTPVTVIRAIAKEIQAELKKLQPHGIKSKK